jgi:hypothetical protein
MVGRALPEGGIHTQEKSLDKHMADLTAELDQLPESFIDRAWKWARNWGQKKLRATDWSSVCRISTSGASLQHKRSEGGSAEGYNIG